MLLKFEYLKILIFFVITFCFVCLLFSVPFFLNKQIQSNDKHVPVECGMEPLGSGKNRMEVGYYRLCILFIIFEAEFIVLVPWILNLNKSLTFSLFPVFFFLILLILGLIYEYLKGIISANLLSGDYLKKLNKNKLKFDISEFYIQFDFFIFALVNIEWFHPTVMYDENYKKREFYIDNYYTWWKDQYKIYIKFNFGFTDYLKPDLNSYNNLLELKELIDSLSPELSIKQKLNEVYDIGLNKYKKILENTDNGV